MSTEILGRDGKNKPREVRTDASGRLVGVNDQDGAADFGGGLTNALQVCPAGGSPAFVAFLNTTGGTLYGVLVQGPSLPADGEPVIDAVKILAGQRETLAYPCRSDGWSTGCCAALSSTPDTLTIAGATAGMIFKIAFPVIT